MKTKILSAHLLSFFRFSFFFILTVFLFGFFCCGVWAEEVFGQEPQAEGSAEWRAFVSGFEALPEAVSRELPTALWESDTENAAQTVEELIGFDALLARILQEVQTAWRGQLKNLSSILVFLVFGALGATVAKNLKVSGETLSLCVCLCLGLSAYGWVKELLSVTVECLRGLTVTVNALLPVTAGIYAACGNGAYAMAEHSMLLLFLGILENFCTAVLMPVLRLCFGFAMISILPVGVDMGGISRLLKQIFSRGLALCMLLLGTVFSGQRAIAASADTLACRTIKFAVGGMIPVVGGAVGDSLRTLAGSLGVIKSTAGVLGVFAVFLLCLPPVVSLLLGRLGLSFSASIAGMLGCAAEKKTLEEMAGVVGFGLAILTCCSLFFVYALACFVRLTPALGG